MFIKNVLLARFPLRERKEQSERLQTARSRLQVRAVGLQSLHVSLNLGVRRFWPEHGFPVVAVLLVWHREHTLEAQPGDSTGGEVTRAVNPKQGEVPLYGYLSAM